MIQIENHDKLIDTILKKICLESFCILYQSSVKIRLFKGSESHFRHLFKRFKWPFNLFIIIIACLDHYSQPESKKKKIIEIVVEIL